MKLGGIQKLTLIDYPQKIATTVFTVGCNFRCPFCHNPELVLPPFEEAGFVSEKEFFDFLKKRKGKLEGVCITGGEPTVQPDLLKFIEKIKKMNFAVKLDSNGTNPEVIKEGLEQNLLDFIAMDIKNSLKNYRKAIGCKFDLKKIEKSVELIKNSRIDYEFRTTVVPGIHSYKDFDSIAKWLAGSKKYVLQKYRDEGKILDKNFATKKYKKILDLEKVRDNIKKYFDKIEIR